MENARALFREQGYVLFEEALSPDELATLRDVCDALLDEPVEDGGGNTHRIGLGKKPFILSTMPGTRKTGCTLFEPILVLTG